jgi:hypothetical protein
MIAPEAPTWSSKEKAASTFNFTNFTKSMSFSVLDYHGTFRSDEHPLKRGTG